MKHTTLISRTAGALILFSGIALCVRAADIQERTLLYPTVLTFAPNILKDAEWRLPVGDSKEHTVERLKGSPFSEEALAWQIRLYAPDGAY